jgi:hypothetical protein
MVKVRWLHVINGSCILLTFDNDETHQVDVKTVLGESAFLEIFPKHGLFATMQIERTGGIIWENGFTISGSALHDGALRQTRKK